MPVELDLPAAHGFTMRGWDFSRAEVAQAIHGHRMLNPAMELGTNICPWNCDFCFTESPVNRDGRKRHLEHELSLERRLRLVDEATQVVLEVSDDGCGTVPTAGSDTHGLTSMRDRARLLGARLEVEGRPGEGTTVRLTLPR